MGFEFVDGLTRADVAFVVEEKELATFLEQAGLAVMDIMADPKTVSKDRTFRYSATKLGLADLLFDFLEEIIFYKDAEGVVFNSCDVEIEQVDGEYRLEATFYGEDVDHEKQKLRVDPKAITMHKFKAVHEDGVYKAQVIVDI